jgi:hypothetical protein
VVVVAPAADGRRWLSAGPVPELPGPVAELLPDGGPGLDAATDRAVSAALGGATASDWPECLAPVLSCWDAALGDGASRHESAVSLACQIVREGLAGYYSLREALGELEARFIEAMSLRIGGGRVLTARAARAEFASIVAWAVGQATPGEVEACRVRIDAKRHGSDHGFTENPTAAPSRALNLPDEFWTERPVLAKIRQAAHARCDSGDVALFAALARLSAQWPHHVKINSGVKGTAIPAFFAAIAGPSGTGKSTSSSGAGLLLPMPTGLDCPVLPIGSGEGIPEALMGVVEEPGLPGPDGKIGKPRKVRQQVRHNALFVVDEGASIAKLLDRNGSTLGETIRSAWCGETLGQANAAVETRRVIPAGSYSVGLTVGFQVGTSRLLLSPDAVDAGMAQRFAWCWAADPSIPDEPVEPPDELHNIEHVFRAGVITFEPELSAQIRAEQLARSRGETQLAPLDSHRPLMLIKLSALLAVLDLRSVVGAGDWALAGIVWRTSCAVRDHLLACHASETRREAQARQDVQVATAVRSRVESDEAAENAAAVRCAKLLTGAVRRAADGSLTHGASRQALQAKDRPLFAGAVELATARGWLVDHGGRLTPGESVPA